MPHLMGANRLVRASAATPPGGPIWPTAGRGLLPDRAVAGRLWWARTTVHPEPGGRAKYQR